MIIKTLKEFLKLFIPWKDREKKIYKLYRKSHFFYNHNMKEIANFYSNKIYKKYNCYIFGSAKIGKNLRIPHPIGIVIGDGAEIGDNVVIYQNVTIGRKYRDVAEYPKIDDNTIIYSNSVIVGNIKIGKNCIIGCNSVILKNVDDGNKVGGIYK